MLLFLKHYIYVFHIYVFVESVTRYDTANSRCTQKN